MESFCSTSRIDTPDLAISAIMSPTCCTILGARPSVGSSMMISSGSPMSVRHIVSICFSPPESTPAMLSARLRRFGNMSSIWSTSYLPGLRRSLTPSMRFWRTVIVGKMSRLSGT